MIQLFFSWLLGKTLNISSGYSVGRFIVNQINIDMKYNGYNKIIIELEEKNKYKLKKRLGI